MYYSGKLCAGNNFVSKYGNNVSKVTKDYQHKFYGGTAPSKGKIVQSKKQHRPKAVHGKTNAKGKTKTHKKYH